MPDYLELTGDNSLVHPKLSGDARVTVHFDWSKAPSAWILATSFGVGSNSDERGQSYSGTWSAVQHALFAAGAFRIRHFRIDTQPAALAIRDQWTFSDEEVIADIQKAVGAVRDFWHDHNFPYFLVTLKQFDNDSGSGDGSAFTNALWIYLSRKDSISDQTPVLIHETFMNGTRDAWGFHRRSHLLILLASQLLEKPVAIPWWNGLKLRLTPYNGPTP
jgi:predicted metalloprotease with PDZ domain